MDFSEFLRRKGAEPRSEDAELSAARAQSAEFEQAAAEIEAFETKLESVMLVQVDHHSLTGELMSGLEQPRRATHWQWLSVAASVFLVASVVWLAQGRFAAPTVEEYVIEHFKHDGTEVLAKADADAVSGKLEQILARFDIRSTEALARQVRYVKICPTPHGKGAHLVMQSGDGPVTVLFMPETEVQETLLLQFEGMEASVIALSSGSAAIIGQSGQSFDATQTLLRTSLLPRVAEA